MNQPIARTKFSRQKDLGDFQTPPGLVEQVLAALGPVEGRYARVLEPTCGVGHFLKALLRQPSTIRELRGFEIQPEHAEIARSSARMAPDVPLVVETIDLFQVNLAEHLQWAETGPLLVIGNLPWVTNSALGASGAIKSPGRTNFRGLRGIEAMTGESNFDISEALWIKLITELAHERPTIALLCKTAVARKVLLAIESTNLPVTAATIWKLEALRWFGASVDACLLRVEVGPGPRMREVPVFADLKANTPESTIGLVNGGRLIADLDAYHRASFADGVCPMTWRQGVKHDASAVMELAIEADGTLRNKLGEVVDVEADHVFPLLKATDLAGAVRPRGRLAVLITQAHLGEDTSALEARSPRLWKYLNSHVEAFERRKSSIYRGRPPFSLFGVGPYSFALHKVAISGLHKKPRFVAVGPVEDKPVMLDDTCYFLACESAAEAETLASILNGQDCLALIRALVFWDAKRPITKAVLQRIDLDALLARDGPWRSRHESLLVVSAD